MHFTYASACFSSTFGPLKGSCGAEGEEEEDNGSRHYLLLSCRLSVRSSHTVAQSDSDAQVDVPAHAPWQSRTRARSPSRRWCTPTSGERWEEQGAHEEPEMLTRSTQGKKKKSRTSTHSHTHTAALRADIPLLSKWSRTGTILHIQGQTWISVFLCRSLL